MKRTFAFRRTERMGLSTLDLYLARAFIAYPAIWAELEARGADRERAEATWHGFLGDQLLNTLEAYREAFGPPAEERAGIYRWSLTLWPEYEWRVVFQYIPGFKPSTPLGMAEIARRVPRQIERVSPLSVEGAKGALRFGYDTFAEVRTALGNAPKEDGWWPWESFEYELPDGSPLQCVFVHGILVDINQTTIWG